MRPFLFLIIVFLLCTPPPAQAQDDFYKKKEDTFYNKKELPKATKEDKGRTLQDIFKEEDEVSAENENKTAAEVANDYFMKCVAVRDDYMRIETREHLCGCVSAKMIPHLTAQEMRALYDEGKEGKNARAKFMIHAYAKCISKPTKEISVQECLKTKQMEQFRTGQWKICNCTAERIQNYIDLDTPRIIIEGTKYDPMTLDPLSHFIGSKGYYNLLSTHLRSCLYKHVYGDK